LPVWGLRKAVALCEAPAYIPCESFLKVGRVESGRVALSHGKVWHQYERKAWHISLQIPASVAQSAS
jgi:hypothetical protein